MNSLDEIDKKDLKIRLRKIEGQVKGIRKMIQNDKYCVDILTQINAARGGLKQVGINILDKHIHGCVKRTLKEDNGEEIINELMDVLGKFTD